MGKNTDMFDTESQPTSSVQVAYLSGSALWPDGHSTHSSGERARRSAAAEVRIALVDRACRVVTDFTWDQPLTIAEGRPIGEALREMMLAGVHGTTRCRRLALNAS